VLAVVAGQVDPLLPPSSNAKAAETAVAAATAAVPSLLLPVQLLLRQRCNDEVGHVEGKFLEVAEGSKLAERMVIQLPGLDAGRAGDAVIRCGGVVSLNCWEGRKEILYDAYDFFYVCT
jgi:hypothetical protein